MICRHCLFHALDRLHSSGGYLTFRVSEHWDILHTLWTPREGGPVRQCVPDSVLRQPWHSVFGYCGHVREGDTHPNRRITRAGIVRSAAILLVLSIWWRLARAVRGLG